MPPSASGGDRWVATGGLAVAAAAGVALSASVAGGGPILAARWGILWKLAAWVAAWALAVVCAFRIPPRWSLGAVAAAALAVRLAALSGPPTLSDDLYRYSWDGRVQAAGVNPYRYAPDSPALTRLHEPWLWPDDAGCAELERPPGCTRINRPSVRTIYPPAAEAWFSAVYRVTGIGARHKAWQVAGLVTDMALVGLLPFVLRAWRRDERWTALYALAPFPAIEVVNNGHADGLVALLLVVALLMAGRRRPALTGALLGAAVLVKVYPLVLLAGLAGLCGRRRASFPRGAAAAGVVVAAGYLPHVMSVGSRVLGYLPGYLEEERYREGGRYLLAQTLGLPAPVTAGLALGGFLAVAVWAAWHRLPAPRAWATLLGALLLAVTPVQPWYAVTLLAVATVAAAPAWSLVAVAGYPYFFAVILDSPSAGTIGRASYGTTLAGIVIAAWLRSRRPTAVDDG